MFAAENLRDWRGKKVFDPSGAKIGKLEQVYVDTSSDEPSFITVRLSGLSGKYRLAFVPAVGVTVSPDSIRVAYAKKLVHDAPSTELDGEFSAGDEPAVLAHYQLEYTPGLSGERRLAQR
jgi:sporulation protein YlmC with PRC-barrel domain